jgi:hypothetical protein
MGQEWWQVRCLLDSDDSSAYSGGNKKREDGSCTEQNTNIDILSTGQSTNCPQEHWLYSVNNTVKRNARLLPHPSQVLEPKRHRCMSLNCTKPQKHDPSPTQLRSSAPPCSSHTHACYTPNSLDSASQSQSQQHLSLFSCLFFQIPRHRHR